MFVLKTYHLSCDFFNYRTHLLPKCTMYQTPDQTSKLFTSDQILCLQ